MVPFAEMVVVAGRARQYNAITLLVAAFIISMLQLKGEHWLVGQGSRMKPWLKSWWLTARLRPFWDDFKTMALDDIRPLLAKLRFFFRAGGYTTMCVSCVNPVTFVPPFGRITAVTIWRTAKLPGSLSLIVILSFLKLLVWMGGAELLFR